MNDRVDKWLSEFLSEVGGCAGTVHVAEAGGLRLAAASNIPEVVQQAVRWVPSGKGMAGLALERGQPVTACNLQTDSSGSLRPGAKAVDAQAAIAFPVRNHDGTILAVVGAAFVEERAIAGSELQSLLDRARSLPSVLFT